jgi:hypothetical protein
MIGAGRMTYSPRRHWRFRARTISVRPGFAYGRVMTLVSFDDDLDWEFAFDSRLELPTGPRRSQWRREPRNGARNCPSCTRMQPASMSLACPRQERWFARDSLLRQPNHLCFARDFPGGMRN